MNSFSLTLQAFVKIHERIFNSQLEKLSKQVILVAPPAYRKVGFLIMGSYSGLAVPVIRQQFMLDNGITAAFVPEIIKIDEEEVNYYHVFNGFPILSLLDECFWKKSEGSWVGCRAFMEQRLFGLIAHGVRREMRVACGMENPPLRTLENTKTKLANDSKWSSVLDKFVEWHTKHHSGWLAENMITHSVEEQIDAFLTSVLVRDSLSMNGPVSRSILDVPEVLDRIAEIVRS